MKKILTAGAVSVALAALPVVGVFATNPEPVQDTVNITVSPSCNISRPTGSGTYSAELTMNAVNTNVGSSTLSVACNNAKGYTVNLTATALTNTTPSTPTHTIPYSTTTPAAGTAAWTVTKGASSSTTNIENGGEVMKTNAADSSTTPATQQVTYKASTSTTQAAGTYTGTATYVLTPNQ